MKVILHSLKRVINDMASACRCMSVLTLLFACTPAFAGVGLSATRLIFDGEAQSAQITFNNTGGIYLVQTSVTPFDSQKGLKGCFVPTPPIFRSESGASNVLRVLRTGCHLPSSRESLFKLRVNAIPAGTGPSPADSSHVSISIGSAIKLYYRPSGLQITPNQARERLQFIRAGDRVVVWNPSPYYLTFASLRVANVPLDLNTMPSMVPPFSTISWPVKSIVGKQVEQVNWSLIDDFGNSTPSLIRKIQAHREVIHD